ncbi:hypothetical protein [Bradyrhizobium sp. DASA03120]|uniref:hypothetical protein n=1 Tax=Bradyrhizobium sp. SMVTL-02 TaxID=3395917 RepID=UPI003F711CA7
MLLGISSLTQNYLRTHDDGSSTRDAYCWTAAELTTRDQQRKQALRTSRQGALTTSALAQIEARQDESVKRMMNKDFAALRTHRNRIHRYRRLLKAKPNGPERQYLERRLGEERCAFDALMACSFPLVFEMPHVDDRESSISAASESAIL